MPAPKVLHMLRAPLPFVRRGAGEEGAEESAPGGPVVECCGCGVASSGLWLAHGNEKGKTCGCNRKFMRFLFFWVNIVLTPFLLVWHFTRAFIVPLLTVTNRHILRLALCQYKLLPFKYYDLRFPPNDMSIGVDREPVVKCGANCIPKPRCGYGCFCCRNECTMCCQFRLFCFNPFQRTEPWARVDGFRDLEGGRIRLFDNKISADDVCQGSVGNCWLISAIAALVEEHPAVVKSLFITRDFDHCGMYHIRLYDAERGHWRTFVIDDHIPVTEDGAPRFTRPNDNKIWVLLLEKAFARMWGSYLALDGGLPSKALTAFTGNPSVVIHSTDSGSKWSAGGKKFGSGDLFNAVHKCLDKGMVMCAGSRKGGNSKGIADGHAYSILDTYKPVAGSKMIKLRNPWGHGEFTGSVSTLTKGLMSMRGKQTEAEEGVFWMPWDAFCKQFASIHCCIVSKDIGSLRLDIHEEKGMCLGPLYGMCWAFVTYCVLCVGCRIMWWPSKKTTRDTLHDAGLSI